MHTLALLRVRSLLTFILTCALLVALFVGIGNGAGNAHAAGPVTIYLTSGSSWTVPADWNAGNNSIEVIGGGGGGRDPINDAFGWAGGGGAYSKVSNILLTPGSSVSYVVGNGGVHASPGGNGGDTYFNGTSCAGSVVCAKGGSGGGVNTFGLGGSSAGGVGEVKYSGGNGGDVRGVYGSGACGGGGAAGPSGNGANGGCSDNSGLSGGGGGGASGGSAGVGPLANAASAGAGGNGRLGTGGGAGGTSANRNGVAGSNGGGGGGAYGSNSSTPGSAGNGGAGSDWDATHGAGGGGGGLGRDWGTTPTPVCGSGGLYGGGGGGGAYLGMACNGAPGIIVIKYTPVATVDATAPSAPAGLAAASTSPIAITLTWSPSSDNVGVVGYQIFRNNVLIGSTPLTTYTDDGLSPNTSYVYSVLAYDASANKSALSTITGTTASGLGVPKIPWYGGPTYWNKFPTAVAAGWNNPSFFPIGVWLEGVYSDADANMDKAAGLNVYLALTGGSNLAALRNTGMTVIRQNGLYDGQSTATWPGQSSETVAYLINDEIDMNFGYGWGAWDGGFAPNVTHCTPASPGCGYTVTQTIKDKFPKDGRPYFNQYGKGILFWQTDENASPYVNSWTDFFSSDTYFYTDNDSCSYTQLGRIMKDGSLNVNNTADVPSAQCHRASSYGLATERMYHLDGLDGKYQPIWNFVEVARAEAGTSGATPALWGSQIKGAVMASIIHGASGILYFNHNFADVGCASQHVLRDACFTTERQAVIQVNGQIKDLATVLNTPSYKWAFNPLLDTILKQGPDGNYYIIAQQNTNNTGTYTFTLPPGMTGSTVTVLYENRTIPISGNSFSDSFAAEYTYHIYKIVPTGGSPTPPPNPNPADTTPPSTPTNFTATSDSSLSVSLKWSPSTDNVGVTGYILTRDGVQIATLPANATSYQDPGRSANTYYLYTLAAVDAAGNKSSVASAGTTTPTSTAGKFQIGQTIVTTAGLNVRSTPTTSGTLLATEAQGATGTVVGGPTVADGYTWWQVKYADGVTGWSVEDYLSASTTPAPSTKFKNGDAVQTTAGLNVRSTPTTSGTLLATEAQGATGTVVGGPTVADGYTWWQVKYADGVTGWSVEDYLALSTAPTPTPNPTPTPVSCTSGQWKAEYFSNQTLSGTPTLTRCESTAPNYSWGQNAPVAGIPADNFSVRWTGTPTFAAGNYTFTTVSDDGVRLSVDGLSVINNWTDHSATTNTGNASLTAGQHTIVMEYYENAVDATAILSWSTSAPTPTPTPPPTPGPTGCAAGEWKAEYFNNITLSGSPVVTQCEKGPPAYSWGSATPVSGVTPGAYSVRWTGNETFVAGNHTFREKTTGGVRVFLDGSIIINDWGQHGSAVQKAQSTLTAGTHSIIIEYAYNTTLPSGVEFSWFGTRPSVSLTANTNLVAPGGSVTLNWNSNLADSCTGTGFTASGTSGTVTVTPAVTTTYVLTCRGNGVSSAAQTTVTVSTQSLNLPRIPWYGGPSYWNRFPTAVAAGWNNQSFFPIGVWLEGVYSDADANLDKAAGLNVYLALTGGSNLASVRNAGMTVIRQNGLNDGQPSVTWPGQAGETVAYLIDDEIDMRYYYGSKPWDGINKDPWGSHCIPGNSGCGYTVAQTLKNQFPKDGRPIFNQYGKGILFWEDDDEAEPYINGPVNNFTDFFSSDTYWYTDPSACSFSQLGRMNKDGSLHFNGPYVDVPSAQCNRASNYGLATERMRYLDALDGNLQPVWNFVEIARPAAGTSAATPALWGSQIKGAVMASIIHGAAGILYFNHNFADVGCSSQHVLRDSCYSTERQAVIAVNSQLKDLATVLNTQSFKWDFGVPQLDTMLKQGPDGNYYIFSIQNTGASGTYTMTLPPGLNGSSATVLYENRSVPITNGKFTDAYTAEYEYHIYKIVPTGGTPTPTPNPTPAPTATLSASPTSIAQGSSSTLSWSSTNATSCSGSGFAASGTSGQVSVSPTATTTYSVTCTNGSATASASATVGVKVTPKPTVTLTASPSSINAGGSSTLTWSSTNAVSCSIPGVASTNPSGSAAVTPTTTTTYTATCTGSGGLTSSASTTVTVTTPTPTPNPTPGAPVVTITASPSSISVGQQSTLSWTATNASTCTASGAWSGIQPVQGLLIVSPNSTAVYTLSCSGNGGTTQNSVTVTVAGTNPVPVGVIDKGSRVQTTENLLVRKSSPSGTALGTQWKGALGVIKAGPSITNGKKWWLVDYDVSPDGWSLGDYLALSSAPMPPTITSGTRVKTTSTLNVRKSPGATGASLGSQALGAMGTVTAGPSISSDGVKWYLIDYDVAPDGWSSGDYLTAVSGTAYTDAVNDIFAAGTSASPENPSNSPGTQYAVADGAITDTLAEGSTGEQVSKLQSLLAALGYYREEVTGYFGAVTRSAVEAFQSAHNLAAVGVVGPQTRALLAAAMATSTTATSTPISVKFKMGDTVFATNTLNVRSAPSTSSGLVGTVAANTAGTVVGGPSSSNGYVWWKVSFATGITGWSVENYLSNYLMASSTTPSPKPPPPPPGTQWQ